MTQFIPSPEQQDIFDAILRSENICVEAVAGSGKTTTIVEGLSRIPRGESLVGPAVVFLAFNKSIADTLKTRVPVGVACSTFHALGFRALKDSGLVARNVRVDSRKCSKLVWNALGGESPDTRGITTLVSLLKGNIGGGVTPMELISHYGLVLEDEKRAIAVAEAVVSSSDLDLETIDFDDMLRMPLLFNVSFDKYDWIFVDEAQDLNGVQHEIVSRLCHSAAGDGTSRSRLVAVGDPHQAIYGFRGAHADSMQRLSKQFSCTTYPLSVSYRCSRAVVKEAQRYLA